LESLGKQHGKVGAVVVKRRAGCGRMTPRLVVMTEEAFRNLQAQAITTHHHTRGGERHRRTDGHTGSRRRASCDPGSPPQVAVSEASRLREGGTVNPAPEV